MHRDVAGAGETRASFRTDIQALRGVAVLLVVFYHAGLPGLTAGYLGVDVFFVISGFLITSLIRKGIEDDRFSFTGFYYRRAKRLLPPAYLVVALTVIAAPWFLGEIELQELRGQVIGAITFTANLVLWGQSGYFDGAAETKALLHFWSLAIEEQYYLVMPALLYFVQRRAWLPVITAILVASLALSLFLASTNPSAAFYLLPTRAWELALGSVGALIPARVLGAPGLSAARIPASAALILVPVFPTGTPHPGLDAFLVCTATLVIILGHNRSRWETTTPIRALAWIGDLSYSLYLVHWPILVFIRAAWMGDPPSTALWIGALISIATSALLFRYVEEPFRRGFLQVRRPLVTGLASASILLCLSPQMMLAVNARTVDYEHLRRRNYGLDFKCAFKEGAYTPGLSECRSRENPQVLIWGDSYAMALAPGLSAELGDAGLEQATSGACGPLVGMAPFSPDPRSPYGRQFAENCIQFNEQVMNHVLSADHLKIVVISSPFTAPVNDKNIMLVAGERGLEEQPISLDLAIEGIRRLSRAVQRAGKRVVVVAPPPVGGFDIGACLERKDRGQITLGEHSDCNIPVTLYRRARRDTIDFLQRLPKEVGVNVIWPSDFLCDEEVCRTQVGDTFIYRDVGHLSYDGSLLFAREAELVKQITLEAR